MRKLAALAVALLLAGVATGCGGGDDEAQETTATGAAQQACAKDQLNLVNPGRLTIGTDNPAFSPWFGGGTKPGSQWEENDPSNGKGYESAVAYAIARELGFARDEVEWVVVPFAQSFKPGPKNFDFDINQVSYNPQRAKAVTFSDSYYDVNQALVTVQGNELADATTLEQVKQAKLGAVIGSTSYQYIVDHIKPSQDPSVYDTLNDNLTAVRNGQIDGLVTDFPTAYYNANVQLENGKLVGRFPTRGQQEYFGLVFEKDNPLVNCVNDAIQSLRQDGTLDRLEQQWITSQADAPLIQ